MSRFEWTGAATAGVAVVPASELANVGIGLGLVIGDPDATALVVEGDRADLLAFVERVRLAVEEASDA